VSSRDHDIFTRRGITPCVADARGYRRYTPDDLSPIYEADPRLIDGTYKDGRKIKRFCDWVEHYGAKSAGWAMPKHALPGSSALAPMLQIRPDVPVPGRKWGHDHAGMEHVRRDCPCGIREHSEKWLNGWAVSGQQLPLSAYERDQHETGKYHLYIGDDGSPLHIDADWIPLPFARRRDGDELPVVGPHAHREMSKYLVAPGEHGKRWDTNPLCTGDDFANARRLFVHLEGALKCDSLVSAGEVCIDVPAVQMWDRSPDEDSEADYPDVSGFWLAWRPSALAYDLMQFFDGYGGAPVIVVCDSDWRHNPEVATPAFCLRDWIRDRGLQCVVAAPPEGDQILYVNARCREVRAKLGSDDFLGKNNGLPTGTPDDLVVVEPKSVPGLKAFEREYARTPRGASGRKSPAETLAFDVELLHWYATHATAEGHVKRPAPTIAARLGVSDDRVYDATVRLADAGALVIEGEYAELVDDRYIRTSKGRTRNLGRGHNGPTATITLRDDLRPTLWQPTVAKWLSSIAS
jgi:hypothetical protein